MRHLPVTLLALLLGAPVMMAAPRATDEILSALQTRLENNSGFEDLIEQLSNLEPRELKRLQAEYDKVWPRLRDGYLTVFKDEARKQHSGTARQANQKEILVARRIELDATLASARTLLGDASLAGRASLLKHLVKQASEVSQGKMVLRPTSIDRAALADSAKEYAIGDDVDGLGGFVLEAEDGSISFDMRFDTLLESAWIEQRAAINETLFA